MTMTPHHGTAPPLIDFSNVTVYRGDTKVLDALTVSIAEGEHVAILGPNGAGKSSFVRAVTREVYPVVSGTPVTFRVRGQDVWDVFALRSSLGVVSNDLQYTFTRGVSGREAVLSGFFSSIGLFNHAVTPAMERKTDEILRFLEIEGLQDRPMASLSSGEARRFLIGRALVHDPSALILDEPALSLDLHALHAFRTVLRKIARNGTGIILVTHSLHDIIPEISRVILMKGGRFVADGAKEAVLTDAMIGGLFSVPVHVHEDDGWYYASGY